LPRAANAFSDQIEIIIIIIIIIIRRRRRRRRIVIANYIAALTNCELDTSLPGNVADDVTSGADMFADL